MKLFDTSALKVGDLWPQRLLQHCGVITKIYEENGQTFAVFANRQEVALGAVVPVEDEETLRLYGQPARR